MRRPHLRDPRNNHPPVLERLSQALGGRVPAELVEEQDAVMTERSSMYLELGWISFMRDLSRA
jgi:hypothetical protein